jgi:hypothetical protein
LTRQPPHIPVPSTMIGLRLTMVLMPRGRVVSAQAFIMTGGPMAITSSMSGWSSMAILMPSVTRPLSPTEPSSLQMMNSSQHCRNLASQKTRSLDLNPTMPIT